LSNSSRHHNRILGVVLSTLMLSLWSAPARAQTTALPATANQQIAELIADKESRTPAQRKISSSLIYTARAKRGLAITPSVKSLASAITVRDDGRVDVEIAGNISKAVIEAIERAGGQIGTGRVAGRVLRAAVPIDRLEEIAALAEVTAIHPAMQATTQSLMAIRRRQLRADVMTAIQRRSALPSRTLFSPVLQQGGGLTPILNAGSANSAGGRAHGVDRARLFYGVTGAGIKVGVLSDSDDFKEASIASGDLPPDTVTIPGQDGRPGSGEGTAMMEIVHDLAPGAKLFFASAFISPESFADNIRRLRFEFGCDIIVDDVVYYFESPYQDDIVAQAVLDVTADGAAYFSSAGNAGNLDDGTSGVWEGDFKKAKTPVVVLPSGYEAHDFGHGVVANRIEVGGGPVILHWSDPGTLANPQSSNDYDLFVLTPDLRTVAVASTDIQNGTGLPFEYLGFDVPAGYQVVVARKVGAADRAVRTQIFNGELAIATDGATYGHSAVDAAFSIAAVDVAQAGTGEFTGGATTSVELYSSDGPRKIFYTPSGELVNGAPLFKGGNGEVRQKPDLTGADGVATTLPSSSGLNPFFGTSAAAPHAAAIAALVKSAKPTITDTKLRNSLKKTATDIEAVGRDKDSGFGIVNAFDALGFIGAVGMPFLELSASVATAVGGDGDAFIEPGDSATLIATLSNLGGATARNLHGTLTTTTPGVTILGGSSTWVDIAPGATGNNTVPFAFNLSPAFTCGAQPDLRLAVTLAAPATSPAVFNFKVPTGTPASTAATFAFTGPRAPIPDSNPAGVSVSIPVTGVGALSDIQFSIDGDTCSTAVGAAGVGIDHTWVGDLVVTLTSPSGTTVVLMNRPGGTGNSGNNFCKTVLSDSGATSIQDVTSSQNPFTGTFKPASPLAAFKGENANGTWVLKVSDLVATDTGGVRAVSLKLKGFACQ
jgi:subtilisin-like proprotein convertase family protein